MDFTKALLCTGLVGVLFANGQTAGFHPKPADQPVQIITINDTWRFIPAVGEFSVSSGDPDAVDAAAKLLTTQLPTISGHSYAVEVPQFLNRIVWWLSDVSPKYEELERQRVEALGFDAESVNAGWYYREINLKDLEIGSNAEIIISFEGVAMISRVYFNGHYVGGHLGMFGEFECRLTEYLRRDQKNFIMVYVQRGARTEHDNQVVSVAVTVPVTQGMLTSLNSGMFGGFGRGQRATFMGIWQPVTLKISRTGGRIKDVFFQPSLDGHSIDITIENPLQDAVEGFIEYHIRDIQTGQTLCNETSDTMILGNQSERTLSLTRSGLSPRLWTPDTPHLYELSIHWKSTDRSLLDRWTHRVGYRTVSVRGTEVLLNGKPYWSRGANQPPYGYFPNDEVVARGFLELMKEGNTVVTRAACNPLNRMWFDLCDEIGIGVSMDGVRPWALMSRQPPPPPAILEHWKQEQLETVKQYRNHPSIMFYCISNEGLQGDHDNPQKLAIFKDIVEAVRQIDPTRPIFKTSGDPDNTGIADIEDMHSYWGWYESSSFVNDYSQPRQGLHIRPGRAFLNQECAVPYQNTDTGGVHPRYIGLYSAHPWVGELGVHGDPIYFSDHIAQEGKLKAEQLRYQRAQLPTAGMMLFANTTWIQDMYTTTPDRWKPFPVWYGVRQAFEPVMVAWETAQYVFYEGQTVETALYVVNDDIHFNDLDNLHVVIEISDSRNRVVSRRTYPLGSIKYYDVAKYPLTLQLPELGISATRREPFTVGFTLRQGIDRISANSYAIEIAPKGYFKSPSLNVLLDGCDDILTERLSKSNFSMTKGLKKGYKADAIVIGPHSNITLEAAVGYLHPGGRILVLEKGQKVIDYAPQAIRDADQPGDYDIQGEFVEMLGWEQGRPLFEGLEAMDWKWWARGSNRPAFACSAAHNIDISRKDVIPIGRFLNHHFYWRGDQNEIYRQKLRYPVFAVIKSWGQLVVCDLEISRSIPYDPRALKTLINLISIQCHEND